MKKVVFIINSVQQQRCLKRIEEFIANGYEVVAYGFTRSAVIPTTPSFPVEIIGKFSNSMSYAKRMKLMYNALKPIFRKHQHEDVIYYYFLLDVAMICRLLCTKPYIYEESDLMQTYQAPLICKVLDYIDRRIISHSLLTIMTSDGFINYHFPQGRPTNVYTVPNRLNTNILNYPILSKQTNPNCLRIAFVGGARFRSVLNFVQVFLDNFPTFEFHFYGNPSDHIEEFYALRTMYDNVYFHGAFANPKDLPQIYSQIDLVLATYDTRYANVRYAEPNKLYEAIYFETPIIVSKGTYLAQKVEKLGIGYAINALDNNEVIRFIKSLSPEALQTCADNCRKIDKTATLNHNPAIFNYLNSKIEP